MRHRDVHGEMTTPGMAHQEDRLAADGPQDGDRIGDMRLDGERTGGGRRLKPTLLIPVHREVLGELGGEGRRVVGEPGAAVEDHHRWSVPRP